MLIELPKLPHTAHPERSRGKQEGNYMLITIVTGISLGFLYAQLFLYQKNTLKNSTSSKTNLNNLASKSSPHRFLVKILSQSVVRIVAILAVFALLLSWTEINFILVTILFLTVFWITILRNIPMA